MGKCCNKPNAIIFSEPGDCPGFIVIEDDVMIGAGVHIYVVKHSYDMTNINIINQGCCKPEDVCLMEECWTGANSIILRNFAKLI